jgi:ethanolamine ammonia-lyase small subunit
MSDAWVALRATTRARIGLGRTGDALPVRDVLEFQLAHARARDAVHTKLDAEALAQAIAPLASVMVRSRAVGRDIYLRRPDLGRQLDPLCRDELIGMMQDGAPVGGRHQNETVIARSVSDAAIPRQMLRSPGLLRRFASRNDRWPPANTPSPISGSPSTDAGITPPAPPPSDLPGPRAVFVIADGLSPVAVQRHAPPLLLACLDRLPGWSIAPVVIATQGRVALGDEIGACLQADLCVVLIGERPGLSVADSLGVYLTYQPRIGRRDSERNCISNIHADGLSYEAAADMLAWLMTEASRRKLTGVELKDDRVIAAPATQLSPER